MPALSEPLSLGGLELPNRVLLAPLAGIGNWFVRLQARRYGAGLAFSEMVSSFAVHHRNARTCTELLRIDPRERPGPVAIQLFGADPAVMRSAAWSVAQAGADLIDLNMGCPVPKVCRTGAGAALLEDPERAIALARAAREGSGLPVTVKLRSDATRVTGAACCWRGASSSEAGVAAISFHPRPASARHAGSPDHALAAELVRTLDAPVLLSGGLHDAAAVHQAHEATGAAAVLLARGSLGNPWLFEQVLGLRSAAPLPEEVIAELDWLLDRACEHLGERRASRYLRRFYPWYVERLALPRARAKVLCAALQQADSLSLARELLAGAVLAPALA